MLVSQKEPKEIYLSGCWCHFLWGSLRKIIPSVRNLNLFFHLSLEENNILMKGSLGLLKFIGDVTKIMALLMGFYNVQKVLSLGYVF